MSERTFTLTLTADQRFVNLYALSFALRQVAGVAPVEVTQPIQNLITQLTLASGTQAADAAKTIQDFHSSKAQISKPSAPVPAQTQDYFIRDRKGNALTAAPTGATLQTVKIQATTESVDRKHLKVIYAGGKANCFDRELWPRLMRVSGQDAQLWIQEKGDFLNVVGIRA
jgi:hypothetical protein